MKAIGVFPEKREVRLVERPEPRISGPAQVNIRMLEVGVCGTDRELCNFVFGAPPEGADHFVLGHESLGEVAEIGSAVENLRPGDLVVGTVRLPCADPRCVACRSGHQDFCSTGTYREHGILGLDGFMAEYVVEQQAWLHRVPAALRDVAVLVEPLTIAEKAFHEIERVQRRLPWDDDRRRAVVLGAGPVGLLGAMKLIHEGFHAFVYSLLPPPNPGSLIAEAIGATYVCSERVSASELRELAGSIDVVYEALGAAPTAFKVLAHLAPNGIFVFTGAPRRQQVAEYGAWDVVRNLVLKNQAVLGVINAGQKAYADAILDLQAFEARWPQAVRSLITGRYDMEAFQDPVMGASGGIKNVIRIAR